MVINAIANFFLHMISAFPLVVTDEIAYGVSAMFPPLRGLSAGPLSLGGCREVVMTILSIIAPSSRIQRLILWSPA
jgi:hypothetical protein